MNPRPPYPEKPKLSQRPPNSITLATFLLACMMVLGGMLIGGAAVLISAPTLFNIPATQAYFSTQRAQLEGQAQALAATEVELVNVANNNDARATAQAMQLEGTRSGQEASLQMTNIAMGNAEALLQQTATQSQNNVYATQTAIAARNEQQMTQVALDYAQTQSALNQNATQVDLNYQATRSALGGTTSPNTSQNVALPTATMTLLPSASALLAITPVPTQRSVATIAPSATREAVPLLTDVFTNGASNEVWIVSSSDAWQTSASGLVTQSDNAWLLSRALVSGNYDLSLIFTPAIVRSAHYDILLNVSNGDGLLVRLTVDDLQASHIGVYRFNGGLPIQSVGTTLVEQKIDAQLVGNSVLDLQWVGNRLDVSLNDAKIVTVQAVTVPTSGAIGVQLPKDTQLTSITVVSIK